MANDATKLANWQRHFAAWRASGLTRRAYCTREGLAVSTFDHWRRQVRDGGGVIEPASAAPVPPAKLHLVPVQLAADAVDSTDVDIVLHSPAGWRIRLPDSIGVAQLGALLAQLP